MFPEFILGSTSSSLYTKWNQNGDFSFIMESKSRSSD